ncbi:MAG: ATP-binding protein [Candidatus Bathyarchaeota archaeon]|nr:MAG: ATP-binding protein [Candidatus Bathyarchaeota archaeon]
MSPAGPTRRPVFPFAAVVGQERVKMALLLSAIDPRLGGILITGPKGSGKSTIVRAMEDILPKVEYVEGCRFNCDPKGVHLLCPSCSQRLASEGRLPAGSRRMRIVELPVGATEEGLLGSIDAEAAFKTGVKRLLPGLLARANQNVLYVDEMNLLPDYLINCILDPAVSGRNFVQREGLSLVHPSRFTLMASMNPEEGRLRPQILDRFALKVEMDQIRDPKQRAEIVRRNMSFEEDPEAFYEEYDGEQAVLRRRIEAARGVLPSVKISEAVLSGIAEACSRLGVEGLRSDIAILKAARALAAFEGRETIGPDDLVRVFNLGVAHRFKDEEGRPKSGPSFRRRLKEILFKEMPPEAFEDLQYLDLPPTELSQLLSSPSDQLDSASRKRRRTLRPWSRALFFAVIVGLILTLSAVFTLATLYFQAVFFEMPVEVMTRSFTLRRFLLHLAVVSIFFGALTILSRRARRPIFYLYGYVGSGLLRRIVRQQSTPEAREEVRRPAVVEDTGIINIPLYASLRRFYKMVVEKGVKFLEVGLRGERRQYRFWYERMADRRLRSAIGRSSKTKARAERGRYVSYEFPKRRPWDVALGPTIRAAAPYQRSRDRGGLALKVGIEDIRVKVREMQAPLTMVLLLDMSESIIPSLLNVRNAILSMRDMAFKRRDRVGLVVFKGEGASTLLSPTTNMNLIVKKVMEVGASDLTPLASGMYEAWRVLRNERVKNRDAIAVLVVISDGIANIPLEAPLINRTRKRFLNRAQADTIDVAHLLFREGVTTMVINPSHQPPGDVINARRKKNLLENTGKVWLEPTELLMEIPKITGGYYYGIGEGGDLEQVVLTEAFSILGRRA